MKENKMTTDRIEVFNDSLIQHGNYNKRIYLMKLKRFNNNYLNELIKSLYKKAKSNGYTKIFAKVPKPALSSFIDAGYDMEARIPGFFRGKEDGLFLSYYLSPDRSREKDPEKLNDVLKLSIKKKKDRSKKNRKPTGEFNFRQCIEKDVVEMAALYRRVFVSYPFPIFDPSYLLKTMRSHVDYFCAEHLGRIVALSSAEKDIEKLSSEMTDFATLPEFRGKGLAGNLLKIMEGRIKQQDIITVYTIARAVSPGMNITFAQSGYEYAGRTRNNTNISGNLESMNIWYKKTDRN